MLKRLWNKLGSRFGRGVEDEVAEEMRLHRELLEERFRSEGLSAGEARHRAAREFGPALAAIEASRAEWSFAWLESVWFDLRYAVRALRRSKAFTATAVLTLGVGLGIASVAFTLVNAYVLRPFAVADPASLYEVSWRELDSWQMHSRERYGAIRSRRDVFADALAYREVFVANSRRPWMGVLVSGNYFRLLGARMAIGRPIEEEDERTPGGDRVVVISHRAWRTAFGADPSVLGKTLRLRGETLEIIGVTAPEFTGIEESGRDFWIPLTLHPAFRRGEPVAVNVIGRLRPGVAKPQAEAALAALARDLKQPGAPDARIVLQSKSTPFEYSPMLLLVFAPVILALALVLATCCANVANMMLARGLARQREMGVRLAIGAGRARLVRQLVTEALLIAGLAGVTGLVFSRIVLDGGERLFFASVPSEFASVVRLHTHELDYRVYLFTLSLAALAAAGAALVPALQATRVDLTGALRGEFAATAAARSSRLRDALVVAQVVVCVVLLACGALIYRRASVFQAADSGMKPQGVVDLNLNRNQSPVATALLTERRDLVEAAAAARRVPFYNQLDRTLVALEGSGNTAPIPAGFNIVSPEYFSVFGIPITRGRLFTDAEARDGSPVAVVSEATARAFWPGEDPLGKTIRALPSKERHLETLDGYSSLRVIGVARDVNSGWVFQGRDKTCLYLPAAIGSARAGWVLVRLRGNDTAASLDKLRRYIEDRWPELDTSPVSMSAVFALQVYPFRAAAWITGMLGLVALGLAVSGIYGVLSYLVTQRSKEIGIRMALGATEGSVMALVLRQCAALSGLGAAIGCLLAGGAVQLLLWWSASVRFLEWDPIAIASGAALALAAALVAAAGPSRRAARVDPNEVLRAG